MSKVTDRIDRAFIKRQHIIRRAMLHELYALRFEDDPRLEGFERDLTHALGHAPDECAFALKFLDAIGHIQCRGVTCEITPQGMQAFEKEFQ